MPVVKDSVNTAIEFVKREKGVSVPSLESVMMNENELENSTNAVCSKLRTMLDAGTPPDMILDTTSAGALSEVVKSLSLSLGIPTLSTSYGDMQDVREWRNLTMNQEKYLIRVRPPGDILPNIIRSIITTDNITNAAVLFDDSFVMHYKYRSLLQNIPVRHMIQKIRMGKNELKAQLLRMTEVDLNNYFVFGSVESIQRVVGLANELKLYGTKYSWFAITKESDFNFKCSCEKLDLIFIKPAKPGNGALISSIVSGSDLKPKLDAGFYFEVAARGLVGVSDAKDGSNWPDFTIQKCSEFGNAPPTERSNLDLMAHFKDANVPSVYVPLSYGMKDDEIYMKFGVSIEKHKYLNSKLVKKEYIGDWTAELSEDSIQYKTGMSLQGVGAKTIFRVVTVLQPPFVTKEMVDGKPVYTGYCIDLINELKNLIEFEYEIYEAPDGQFGRMDENEDWNGMIKELIDKKADIALGALSVMAERENVIDFTVPYYDLVGIIIMMKKPKLPTSLFKFLSVLEDQVWGCILAAYFATSFLMWIFDKYSPYSYQNNIEKYEDDDEKRYFNFKECLWFCLTSLTPQGGGEAPKNLSGRLVAATWWLFGFIIIASYTANLAAFLTVSRLETPVESLEDLSKQYKIQYAPMNGSATMTYFERMAYIEDKFYEIWKDMSLNDSLSELEKSKLAVWDYPVSDKYTKMWQSMKEANLPQTFTEALERVRSSPSSSEGFAFLGDATDIRYQVLTNCDLQMVGEEFSRKPYAIAVQQGSPLKDQFNDAILKLLNQRKLETLKERWWNGNRNKKNCEEDDDSGGGISIYNIGGVFIVIFVGIGLAIIILIFEYWYYKYKVPQNQISDKNLKILQVKKAHIRDKTDFSSGFK
uniref:Ionotropic glutamate receptor 25a n=3 Tax=Caligus rogercresseyi TaxID=217165 RepID=X2J0U5_CALRO|nr:ionotropic glutamate receptor 25a [Caligus rogercresseyi]